MKWNKRFGSLVMAGMLAANMAAAVPAAAADTAETEIALQSEQNLKGYTLLAAVNEIELERPEITSQPAEGYTCVAANGNSYKFDQYGRAVQKGGLSYEYNTDGTVSKIIDVSGVYQDFVYDKNGRCVKEYHRVIEGDGSDFIEYCQINTYDESGNKIQASVTNNVYSDGFTGALLSSEHYWTTTYSYNTNGLLTKAWSTWDDGSIGCTHQYYYDSKNNLTKLTVTDPCEGNATYTYEYDANGNRTKINIYNANGTKTNTITYDYALTSRVKQVASAFSDLAINDWYTDAVLWAVNKGVTTGTSSTTFSPSSTCTRAQIVTFLWRSAGSPNPSSTSNPFKDVSSSEYYYKAVLWAVEKGITTGTSATTFSPGESCTRAQAVTFIWRANGQKSASASNPFQDVLSGQWYTNSVLWAVANGITTGTSNTTFSPDNACTRAQIVTFLYRAAN